MPLILGSAADHFSLSAQQLGLLGSSLLGGWLVATMPAYFCMHKINRKWVVLSGATLSFAGFLVSQFVSTVSYLNLSWSVAGFGAALIYCVAIQVIAETGKMERAFGFRIISEVSSAAISVIYFPRLLLL